MRLAEIGYDPEADLDEDEADQAADLDADSIYEGDCGYWVVVMLRGNSTGRKVKRIIWKMGLYQCISGFWLLVIATNASYSNALWNIFMIQQPGMGARLFDLFWLVCFPALLIGAWSMLMVRYWASLCTNRVLLINMIKVYMCVQAFLFIFVLWCTCVLFILFKPFDWQNKLQLRDYFATFFFSTAFILPYLLAIVYYLLDLSYYLEELAYPQVDIEEPYPPQYDLSELSLTDLCLGWLAVPIALCIQLYDIYRGLKNAYVKYLAYRRRKDAEQSDRPLSPSGKVKRKGLPARFSKTVTRALVGAVEYLGFGGARAPLQPAQGGRGDIEAQLLRLQKEKEEEARLEREREEEERVRRERDEAARRAAEEEAARVAEEEDVLTAVKLTTGNYTRLWSELPTGGQFSCKLKEAPSQDVLQQHLEKQGFHVVYFKQQEQGGDMELGICNVRNDATEPWFLARFLVSPSNFAAVMKAQQESEVAAFVKRFSLARVLKIKT